MNVLHFKTKKENKEKISMVTCYDFWSAKIIADSNIDTVLVGDSASMVMHGHNSTLSATVDLMALHIQAVRKGAPEKFIVGDMPFLSYRKSLTENMDAVQKIMSAGAEAIKLEGVDGNEELVTHIVSSGVPVMGHLGLTPQSINTLGGYRVQGRGEKAGELLLDQAQRLENAGCFALVLECVPSAIARKVSETLSIPTIGIGAGPDTDGQVLVLQDMLGMNKEFKPKFLREYMKGYEEILNALNHYHKDVTSGAFPNIEESYE